MVSLDEQPPSMVRDWRYIFRQGVVELPPQPDTRLTSVIQALLECADGDGMNYRGPIFTACRWLRHVAEADPIMARLCGETEP